MLRLGQVGVKPAVFINSSEDRYGAAICEGDILNVRGRGEWGEAAVIVWRQRRNDFVYTFPGDADEPIALRPGADIEVVGNIHAHPALMGEGDGHGGGARSRLSGGPS